MQGLSGRRTALSRAKTHVLALRPIAPHAAVLKNVLTSVKIDDGVHTVGQDMEPGTYRTKPSAKDCSWSRSTGGGGIIANDMVGFALRNGTIVRDQGRIRPPTRHTRG